MGNKNKKRFIGGYDKSGKMIIPVYNDNGMNHAILPQVTITPRNIDLASAVSEGRNRFVKKVGERIVPVAAGIGIGSIGVGLATAPILTVSSIIGGVAGDRIGEYLGGDTGRIIGGLLGGAAGSISGSMIVNSTPYKAAVISSKLRPKSTSTYKTPSQEIVYGDYDDVLISNGTNGKIIPKPSTHLQGDEAVKMFKEYGGIRPPKNTEIRKQVYMYVPEARERYGLVGRKEISNDEIANSIYKRISSQSGLALDDQGNPQLLFRADTKRYNHLINRIPPKDLVPLGGTMDNSLGNLFLGGNSELMKGQGIERYLVSFRQFGTGRFPKDNTGRIISSGTGSQSVYGSEVESVMPEGSRLLSKVNLNPRGSMRIDRHHIVYKVPSRFSKSGVNDVNGFVVRTPSVRNSTNEISVLDDDFALGASKFNNLGKGRIELDKDGFPVPVYPNRDFGDNFTTGYRTGIADHYNNLLKESVNNNQGLLKSNAGSQFREEHRGFDYFAVPNWNRGNVKHILPYDIRIPANWRSSNIYE